jgi:hypothetical protein
MSEKYYQLGTHNAEQFFEIHDLLCSETSEEHIPDRECACYDDKIHSPTRGTFLLTDEEAAALKNDHRIKFINIDYSMYEDYKPPQNELQAVRPNQFTRYTGTIKNYREFEISNTLPGVISSNDANRTGYQLYRHQQFLDPWVDNGNADNDVLEVNISQYGSGKHIDVIVADEGCWIGHPEFQNSVTLQSDGSPIANPTDYVGGNVLPGNGTCDILDIVLDGPYYIDPEYFDADPDNRLETRWDGTIVPVETVARAWWFSPANRSPQFAGIGSIFVSASYTRANTQGNNTGQPLPFLEGQHGTCCSALAYGRTQGWAYNANKWMIDLYGGSGAGIEIGFDIQKMFHLYKPINPLFGVRNPTISSNSWGYRDADKGEVNDWYHFRADGPIQYGGSGAEPTFISHMGVTGDGGRWKSEMKTNSLTTAQDELIDAGVIFVVAAGNSNQKQVNWGHPDFNNYISASALDTIDESSYTEFGVEVTGTTNRRGFPQQGGKTVDDVTGEVTYKTINVGALDDDFNGGLEAKVNYSDRGNGIDVYAAGDGSLAANKNYTNEGIRPDTYEGLGLTAYDTGFGGTSAACPVVAGFLATVLEHNRDWTYKEIKEWIAKLDAQDPSDFYYGAESTTASAVNWLDYQSLEGGEARVLYQGPFDARYVAGPRRVVDTSISLRNGLTLRFNK